MTRPLLALSVCESKFVPKGIVLLMSGPIRFTDPKITYRDGKVVVESGVELPRVVVVEVNE